VHAVSARPAGVCPGSKTWASIARWSPRCGGVHSSTGDDLW
jgi:hypothetical protein